MNLTIAQLRAFERIVRLGSFRAAADQLGLTQPSVSQRIQELERILGAKLFQRRGPRVNLTVEGQALIDYADQVLDTAGTIVERFRSRDPKPIYRRLRDQGRQMPDGLKYVDSWNWADF